jgi:3-methyladenine DNA glycosylase AlkD
MPKLHNRHPWLRRVMAVMLIARKRKRQGKR